MANIEPGGSSNPAGAYDSRPESRRSWFGIASVSIALIALSVVATIGARLTDEAAARTERSVLLNAAYQRTATGVGAEESLERKYRLEPGPEPLAAHVVAQQEVAHGLADIARLGNPGDRALVATLVAEHTDYVAAAATLFAAVDRHEPTAALIAIDNQTVDPVFGTMQTKIYAAAGAHQVAALNNVDDTHGTGHLVFVLDLVIAVTAATLIALTSYALIRSYRRLRRQSDLNEYQSLHDSLTGLPNRVLFQDRSAQALRAAKRSGSLTAVMLIDVDRFKDVNDTLGHHYGDLLLEQIAQRFSGTLRAGDSVARLGGDEFAVLLLDTTRADALAAAQRLTEALEEAFVIRDVSLDVEASIGIALAGPDTDVETAVRHADIAMYEAKTQHLGRSIYELSRDDNTVARLALLGDLRRAIGRGELILQYQPKVDTINGAVHSVEALVRWQHPTRGILMPDEFIPVAEGTAVIHPLTDEVIRQALIQANAWHERGWSIPVSVNISARSLHDLGFPTRVRQQLERSGLPASALSLELTEGAIMTDPPRAIAALNALDAMGIALSIDDFGTGFSSMAYLKDLPVRELKIDRSFVAGMNQNNGDLVLVRSAVDLGHNLGLHVVAEGVEDAATQVALQTMGCDLVQGYYVRRPASATDLDAWLSIHATTDPNLADVATSRRPPTFGAPSGEDR